MSSHALQLLLPSGDPNGLKVISLSGWTAWKNIDGIMLDENLRK